MYDRIQQKVAAFRAPMQTDALQEARPEDRRDERSPYERPGAAYDQYGADAWEREGEQLDSFGRAPAPKAGAKRPKGGGKGAKGGGKGKFPPAPPAAPNDRGDYGEPRAKRARHHER